jgi:hypothetical protein
VDYSNNINILNNWEDSGDNSVYNYNYNLILVMSLEGLTNNLVLDYNHTIILVIMVFGKQYYQGDMLVYYRSNLKLTNYLEEY